MLLAFSSVNTQLVFLQCLLIFRTLQFYTWNIFNLVNGGFREYTIMVLISSLLSNKTESQSLLTPFIFIIFCTGYQLATPNKFTSTKNLRGRSWLDKKKILTVNILISLNKAHLCIQSKFSARVSWPYKLLRSRKTNIAKRLLLWWLWTEVYELKK